MTKSKSSVNVWLGAETGLLKAVDFSNKSATNHFSKFGKKNNLLSLCYDSETNQTLYSGHVNGKVRKFDIATNLYTDSFDIPGYNAAKERLVSIYHLEKKFVTCTTEGNLKVWNSSKDVESEVAHLKVGSRVQCTAFNPKQNLVATGGYSNCLKLWDLNKPKAPIFQARNVKPDWLQLTVPINVMQVAFIPDGSDRIFTTTGTHNLRVYDPKSSERRPVLETSYLEHPITAAAVCERDPNLLFVGNTRGYAAGFDLRKLDDWFRAYKGIAGSVRCIAAHKTEPYFFSCGLDRHLYAHRIGVHKPEYKVYLKSKLNCLMASDASIVNNEINVSNSENNAPRKRKIHETNENDDDVEADDEMWNKMKKVSDDEDDSDDDDDSF